ncbi:DNA polymerase [Bradyrhizobium sp. UFLA05-153]
MSASLVSFREVVVLDFEFEAPPGERQIPVCCVAYELRSGRLFQIWEDEFATEPPFATGPDVLCVAFFASAEWGCYRALGWPPPLRVLDLYAEQRCITNGLSVTGRSLVAALAHYGIPAGDAAFKDAISKAIGAGVWRDRYSKEVAIQYCTDDVVERTVPLLGAMLPAIDLPRALLRGRGTVAVAAMEHEGVPIDTETLAALCENWECIEDLLIGEVDRDYCVYDGRAFREQRFLAMCAERGIPWPLHESGRPVLDDDTWKDRAHAYPCLVPLRELRNTLSEMRLHDLAVGRDGRNRTLLSPFSTTTSRNAPSNAKFVFGPAKWIRGLIKPPPGHGVALVDWKTQEIGIAAKLSNDPTLMASYLSGDVYIDFGKRAGVMPFDADEESHGDSPERALCKSVVLAVNYGQSARGMANRLDKPECITRELVRVHREQYPRFWEWSDATVDRAILSGSIRTVFGWTQRIPPSTANYENTAATASAKKRKRRDLNPRSLMNFPMQAHGAEMMRLAACLATERGLRICAPVHDAFLLIAPLDRLEADTEALRACMVEASRVVLDGFELGTDAKLIRYPDRYMKASGAAMWGKVMKLLNRCERAIA